MSSGVDWVNIIEYFLGSLSIIGCFFVILVFVCYKEIRSFPFESVVYLTISSMITAISYLLYYIKPNHKSENESACQFQAFIMVWFENSQYLWASLIGYSVYQKIINFDENDFKTTWAMRCKYLGVGYVFPFILALICLLRGVYGQSGRFCWISTEQDFGVKTENTIFQIFLYCMIWVLIIINFAFTIGVVNFLDKNFTSREEREITKRYIWKLLRYPIIQAILIIPSTINRFLQIIDKESEILQTIHVYFVASQGLIYAIAYGYNSQVINRLVKTFKVYCYCCPCLFSTSRSSSDVSEASFDNTITLYDRSGNL
jgi:hypothetical protein